MTAPALDVTPTPAGTAAADTIRPAPRALQALAQIGGLVGIVVAVIGLIVVIIGWNGAASDTFAPGQTPYLLSGGFLGLALTVLGAALLVTQSARQDGARLEAKLEEVIAAVDGAPAPEPVTVVPLPPALQRIGDAAGIIGMVLIGLGLLVVALGWNGAAGDLSLSGQTPYLLSGGFLGLGLVVFGAALVTSHYHRADRVRLSGSLDRLVDAVDASRPLTAGAATPRTAPSDVAGLVAAGTASYHVPTCRLVEGRADTAYLLPAEATGKGLLPCRVCKPDEAFAAAPRNR